MKIKEIKNQKNKNGIGQFLRDSAAISPAIATLILIVIAAVAAAGVGILVQSSQKNAQDQTANKDLSVSGEFTIKGSNILQDATNAEVSAFSKLYPAIKVNIGAGNSGAGRALVFNKQIEVGASAEIWPDATTTDSTTGITYDGRSSAVIQGSGLNAFVYETKIGTGLVSVVGNIPGVTAINITNATVGTGNQSLISLGVLTISFNALHDAYASTTGTLVTNDSTPVTIQLVQRADEAAHEQIFAKWIGLATDSTEGKGQLPPTSGALKIPGISAIRDYIAKTPNTIGFLTSGYVISPIIAATQNGVAADKTTKGIGGKYGVASKAVSGGTKELTTDLYYYSQSGVPTGAVKAYLDYVLTNDGQTIIEKNGFYRP